MCGMETSVVSICTLVSIGLSSAVHPLRSQQYGRVRRCRNGANLANEGTECDEQSSTQRKCRYVGFLYFWCCWCPTHVHNKAHIKPGFVKHLLHICDWFQSDLIYLLENSFTETLKTQLWSELILKMHSGCRFAWILMLWYHPVRVRAIRRFTKLMENTTVLLCPCGHLFLLTPY